MGPRTVSRPFMMRLGRRYNAVSNKSCGKESNLPCCAKVACGPGDGSRRNSKWETCGLCKVFSIPIFSERGGLAQDFLSSLDYLRHASPQPLTESQTRHPSECSPVPPDSCTSPSTPPGTQERGWTSGDADEVLLRRPTRRLDDAAPPHHAPPRELRWRQTQVRTDPQGWGSTYHGTISFFVEMALKTLWCVR